MCPSIFSFTFEITLDSQEVGKGITWSISYPLLNLSPWEASYVTFWNNIKTGKLTLVNYY